MTRYVVRNGEGFYLKLRAPVQWGALEDAILLSKRSADVLASEFGGEVVEVQLLLKQ